jgi:predicted DCC family thiol-disulfide oxidoreductase YuxK
MDRDTKDKFRFAALQSGAGAELQKKFGFNPDNLSTLILIDEDKYYTKTTGALRIAKELRGLWKLSYVFIIIPPFIRNIVYNIVAKYRYKWFGKREACRIPNAAEKAKFL